MQNDELVAYFQPQVDGRTNRVVAVEALMAQMDKDCEAARVAVAAVDREDPMDVYPLGRKR